MEENHGEGSKSVSKSRVIPSGELAVHHVVSNDQIGDSSQVSRADLADFELYRPGMSERRAMDQPDTQVRRSDITPEEPEYRVHELGGGNRLIIHNDLENPEQKARRQIELLHQQLFALLPLMGYSTEELQQFAPHKVPGTRSVNFLALNETVPEKIVALGDGRQLVVSVNNNITARQLYKRSGEQTTIRVRLISPAEQPGRGIIHGLKKALGKASNVDVEEISLTNLADGNYQKKVPTGKNTFVSTSSYLSLAQRQEVDGRKFHFDETRCTQLVADKSSAFVTKIKDLLTPPQD